MLGFQFVREKFFEWLVLESPVVVKVAEKWSVDYVSEICRGEIIFCMHHSREYQE